MAAPVVTASDLRANLARVQERIAAAARRVGRDPAEVTLVAVAKTHPPEMVAALVEAGARVLGENRVQEAAAKIPRVADLLGEEVEPPQWHLVGHLQTNKAKQAVSLFEVIESVDSVRVAEALDKHAQATRAAGERLTVLLEVYVGDDPSRPGFRPAEIFEAAGLITELSGLRIEGLMTVAPLGWDAPTTRAAFRQVRELRDALARQVPGVHWQQLSMGMTEDFEPAIEEGATVVRIGRALFGPRETV